MSTVSPSEVPNPPKTVGLSRRFLLTLMGTLLVVVVLFLVFLKHYAPQTHMRRRVSSPVVAREVGSPVALIDKIHHGVHRPLIVSDQASVSQQPHSNNGLPSSHHQERQLLTSEDHLTGSVFKAGSNAPISVYHHTQKRFVARQTGLHPKPVFPVLSSSDSHLIAVTRRGAGGLQNQQQEKRAFLKGQGLDHQSQLAATLQHPSSPYEITAGTVIPASLVTGIQSDLPGNIIARVRSNIYDTVTGNYLLIPQGTTLLGVYDSQVSYGQSRVLMVWMRLIFPNGDSLDLTGMPGADLSGMAGLQDRANHHYPRIFGSALLMSVFGALGQLSQPRNNSNQLTAQQIIYGAIGQKMGQTAIQLIAKNMNVQPTLTIRPGANFNVLLTRDMVFPGAYHGLVSKPGQL